MTWVRRKQWTKIIEVDRTVRGAQDTLGEAALATGMLGYHARPSLSLGHAAEC